MLVKTFAWQVPRHVLGTCLRTLVLAQLETQKKFSAGQGHGGGVKVLEPGMAPSSPMSSKI